MELRNTVVIPKVISREVSTMHIGFDLDKVFVDYPPLIPTWLIDFLYRNHRSKRLVYRIPGVIEQKLRKASHYPSLRPALRENIAFLQRLASAKKHRLSLVSSRFSFLKQETEELIKRLHLDTYFSVLQFNFEDMQPHEFKLKTLKSLGITHYVDDDLALLEYLGKKLPRVTFFWLNPRIKAKISDNIFAVTSLSHIPHD